MNKNILSLTFQEFIIVALIGGFPLFLTYELSGGDIDILTNTTKSLLPDAFQLSYAFILSLPAFITMLIKWFFFIHSERTKLVFEYVISIFSKVSDGFLGIFRAATGVLLYFPIFWVCYGYDSFDYSKVYYFHTYGLIALVECASISWFQNRIKELTYN